MGVDFAYAPAHLYTYMSQSVRATYYSPAIAQLYRDGMPNQCRFVRKLVEAGGPIMAGTDALVPGIALHGEIRALAACGVSNFEAMKAATATPGRWFAIYKPDAERFGTVEAGKSADLALFEANPTANLSNLDRISAVVTAGRWLDRAELGRRLQDLPRRNAQEIARLKAAAAK